MSKQPVTDRNGITEEQFLKTYDAGVYERPSVTVDMLIFTVMEREQDNYRKLSEKSLQLLLIQRGEHPYLGQWALPGGFVGVHESLDEAARRELFTETNIDNIYMEQLYTWGEVQRDPRMRVISCSYMTLVDRTALNVQAGMMRLMLPGSRYHMRSSKQAAESWSKDMSWTNSSRSLCKVIR